MIELVNNKLNVVFPEVHEDARCSIEFQRTLRVPDDNQDYPLPAGLGRFSMLPVDDFDVPAAWKEHGGVFFPMYQAEAMWINFRSGQYPFAVKIAAGKINAVTGQQWSNTLNRDPQDYLVIPEQPWLDGFSVAKDAIRQFVAAPLGQGLTAEEQITGKLDWGGLQLIFYPMKAEEYRKLVQQRARYEQVERLEVCEPGSSYEMGLAAGGRIRQEIAADRYGLDVWDTSVSSRCFVHILNSGMYQTVTGQSPPTKPVAATDYAKAGIPWFDFYLEGKTLDGSSTLAGIDSMATALLRKGKKLEDNKPIQIAKTIDLSKRKNMVRDGCF